jgi:hypothetical protein
MMDCKTCGEPVSPKRWSLGYRLCLPCGERQARQRKHCIVPMHKSNYTVVSNPADLIGFNCKR